MDEIALYQSLCDFSDGWLKDCSNLRPSAAQTSHEAVANHALDCELFARSLGLYDCAHVGYCPRDLNEEVIERWRDFNDNPND